MANIFIILLTSLNQLLKLSSRVHVWQPQDRHQKSQIGVVSSFLLSLVLRSLEGRKGKREEKRFFERKYEQLLTTILQQLFCEVGIRHTVLYSGIGQCTVGEMEEALQREISVLPPPFLQSLHPPVRDLRSWVLPVQQVEIRAILERFTS